MHDLFISLSVEQKGSEKYSKMRNRPNQLAVCLQKLSFKIVIVFTNLIVF